MSSLADLLGKYLQRAKTSVNRLAKLSGVPQRTISNWLNGYIHKPHQWQALVKVALALHLPEPETDTLLHAAGHPHLAELHAKATTPSDLNLLANFQPATSNHLSSPFQAIADLPTFVGRENELETVKRAVLDGGRAAICGLRGMGGVGKTTLAAHLAYHVRDQFPDGVLWARLDTSDPLSILGSFADAYGKDVSQYKDVESRAAVVRNLLANKRALIVLDNAETSAQVRPMLPPSTGTCAVLITTRQDLSVLDGWERLTLEPFDVASEESLDLFAEYLGQGIVDKHQTALREIAALLGHLPLALAITAGRLAYARPRLPEEAGTISAFLTALKESHTRLDALTRDDLGVRASFEVSYTALAPEMQRFFAALGVFGGEDFGAEAVAYLHEIRLEDAQVRLQNLVALSLVQISLHERYRLHPLLRDFAREKLTERDWLVAVVELMLQMYQQAAQGKWHFTRSLDAEMLNVRYALDQAADLGLRSLFLETIQTLYPIWSSNGWHTMAFHYLGQARNMARMMGNSVMEIRIMTWIASMQNALGEVHAGQQTLQTVMKMAQSTEQIRELADILCVLGKSNSDQGEFFSAEPYYVQSLALARQVNDPILIARNLNNLGLVEHTRANFQTAEGLFSEALIIFRSLDFALGINVVQMNLADLYYALGEIERARVIIRETQVLAREHNQRPVLIGCLQNLAVIHTHYDQDLKQAESLLLEALKIAKEISGQRLESQLRVAYANVLRLRGDFDQAQQQIQQSLALSDHLGDIETRMTAFCLLGELLLDQHHVNKAQDFLNMAYALAQKLDSRYWLAEILYIRAQAASVQARPALAVQLAQESLQRFEKVGPPLKVETVRRWLAHVPGDL